MTRIEMIEEICKELGMKIKTVQTILHKPKISYGDEWLNWISFWGRRDIIKLIHRRICKK